MRVTVDLGFYSLLFVVLVCVVFPVIGLVVRYTWRRSEERAGEIKRLLILAAEESARAEREAAASYHYDDANSNSYQYVAANSNSYQYVACKFVSKRSQCVVCFSPTTNRCARCKSCLLLVLFLWSLGLNSSGPF
ncbi:unnamed protein product [Vicia faba]|uniref:Uncharacterized protein n=1 Tax=Vicia faba TaxID=3906 RepID=A0AAV0YN65_VICFA|nr:unnamed protein product [Vicia faba]